MPVTDEFTTGDSSCFIVEVIDHNLYEPEEEYFTIILTSTDDSVHVSPGSIAAIVSIIDDNGKMTQYFVTLKIKLPCNELSKIRCKAWKLAFVR